MTGSPGPTSRGLLDERTLRAEALEGRVLHSLYEACSPALRDELGFGLTQLGAALAAHARHEPSILFNRAFVPLAASARDVLESVSGLTAHYRALCVSNYFLHVHMEPAGIRPEQLLALGLAPARAWRKFHHSGVIPVEPNTTLQVRRLTPADTRGLAEFGRIAAAAFDLRPPVAELFGALVRDPRWQLFMSFDGDVCVGTGGLFVDRDPESGRLVAHLDLGATDPRYRGRGGQGALLVARTRRAFELGCEDVFTMTGEAVPGDPQHSYRNILRFGFVEGVLRENFRPQTFT